MADITHILGGAFDGNAAVAPNITPADEYIEAGLALVRLKPNTKDATQPGWQLPGHGITNGDAIGASFGLHHLDSGTCALDFDNYADASAWLDENGIDAQALLLDDDAVQIRSGRANRAKLLYRLPDSVDYLPTHKLPCGLELRCANRDGTSSAQDVLPPSFHPDTGKPYEWLGDWRTLPVLPDDVLHVWLSLDDAKPAEKAAQDATGVFTDGHRDDALTSLAGTMRHYGFSEQAIYAALHEENARRCDPPKSDKAIRRIAGSISKKEPDTDVAASTVTGKQAAEALLKPERQYHPMSAADVLALPDIQWLVDEVLPSKGLGYLFGESGAGKSFIALDMACHIAEGRRWFGYDVVQREVLYLVLEGANGFKQRIQAWEKANGRAVPDGVRFIMEPFYFAVPGCVPALMEVVPQEGLTIIDTQARAAAGTEENSAKEMGQIVEALDTIGRDTDGFVLAVAHSGKDISLGQRGSSAQKAAADAQISVLRHNGSRQWQTAKSKDAADDVAHGFSMDVVEVGTKSNGKPITSCAISPAVVEDQPHPHITKGMQFAMDAYHDACMAGRCEVSDAGEFMGLHLEAWREFYYRNHTGDNAETKRRSFSRARADLRDKTLCPATNDVYLCQWDSGTICTPKYLEKKMQHINALDDSGTAGHSGTNAGHVPHE